jgi:hypothetical protein
MAAASALPAQAATAEESIIAICVQGRTASGEANAVEKCSCEVSQTVARLDPETLRIFGLTAEVALTLPEQHTNTALMDGVKARGVSEEQFNAALELWSAALMEATVSCGTN